jgi:hypothetical protein
VRSHHVREVNAANLKPILEAGIDKASQVVSYRFTITFALRQSTGLGGSGFFGLATSPPIGQALAASSFDRAAGALGIVDPELDAVRIAEIELGEVAMQMLFADADTALLAIRRSSVKYIIAESAARRRPQITGPFDGFHATQASVSKTCLVRFDNNKYSVASRAVGSPIEIQAYADPRPRESRLRDRDGAPEIRPLAKKPGSHVTRRWRGQS